MIDVSEYLLSECLLSNLTYLITHYTWDQIANTPFVFFLYLYSPLYVYSYRHLIIENFIPLEEKSKIMNRSFFDEEEDHWKLHPITRLE